MSAVGVLGVERVLPGARSGADLVPGVPARVLDLAEQLEDMARGLGVVHRLMAMTPPLDGWQGAAAVNAAYQVRSLPKPYARAARVIGTAAAAVRSHAEVLAAAQRSADEAVYLDLRAAAVLRTSGPPSGGALPPAMVTSMQRRALALVEQARAVVRASAVTAAAGLSAAADAAPDQPNLLLRALHEVIEVDREIRLGMVESTVATVSAIALYSPSRLLFDRDGYLRDLGALATGLGQLTRHPGQGAKTLVDWENLRHNQGRWVGRLAPDVVAGVLTGGTAAVANRGISVGVRAAAVVTKGQTRVEIRAAMDAARATSRSRLLTRDLRGYRSKANDFGHIVRLTAGQNLITSALARDARWAAHDLTARVQAAARSINVKTAGLEHAVKGRDSLSRKVSERLAKPGAGVKTVIPTINDTVRYTLVADPKDYVGKAREAVTALRQQQMILVEAKSYWGGERYQGLNITFADPRTGRLLEVQVHTPDSYQAGVDTHADYERYRQVGIPPDEKDLLEQKIREVYEGVEHPPGINGLNDALASGDRWPEATNRPPELLSPHPLARPAAIAGSVAVSSIPSGGDGHAQR